MALKVLRPRVEKYSPAELLGRQGGGIFSAADADVVPDDVAQSENQSGTDGDHPDVRNLLTGGQRIHNAGYGGGDQDSQEAGGGQHGAGIFFGIMVLLHFRRHDFADGADGGHGGAGQNTERHGGKDADDAQGTADTTNDSPNPVDQAFGNAAVFHQGAGVNKEGNG